MKERVEVALVQMSTEWLQPEKNLEKMLRFLAAADKIPGSFTEQLCLACKQRGV